MGRRNSSDRSWGKLREESLSEGTRGATPMYPRDSNGEGGLPNSSSVPYGRMNESSLKSRIARLSTNDEPWTHVGFTWTSNIWVLSFHLIK